MHLNRNLFQQQIIRYTKMSNWVGDEESAIFSSSQSINQSLWRNVGNLKGKFADLFPSADLVAVISGRRTFQEALGCQVDQTLCWS